MRCYDLPGLEEAGWFYGLATEQYSTFAALMASVAAASILVVPDAGVWTKPARRLYLGAFFSLLIATTLYGEVAGSIHCDQQAVTGSAASMLLAVGSAVLVLTSISFLYQGPDSWWPRMAMAAITGTVATSSLVVGIRLSRLLVLDKEVGLAAWVVLVSLTVVLIFMLHLVVVERGGVAFVDVLVVSLAVLTSLSFLGTAAALTTDLDLEATLVFLALMRAAGASIVGCLAVQIARKRPLPEIAAAKDRDYYIMQS